MEEKKAYIENYGPWQTPVAAHNVLCSDGKRRFVRITSPEPLDAWSLSAAVQIKGKTVSGFITGEDYPEKDIKFHAYQNKKNGYLLP